MTIYDLNGKVIDLARCIEKNAFCSNYYEVFKFAEDLNEILGLSKPVVDNKPDNNKSDTSTPDNKLLDMIKGIQQLMDKEGRNINYNKHVESFMKLLQTCLARGNHSVKSIEFCLYDFIDDLINDNYPAIKLSVAKLLNAVYNREGESKK